MQTPVPVPRQTANSTAQAGSADQKQGQKSQTDSRLTPATVPQGSDGPPQERGGQEHSNDQPNPATISKLPPVSISRDWADRAIWIFNGLLVVVGIAQVALMFLNAEGIPQPQSFHRWAGGGLKGFSIEKDAPQRLLQDDED